MRKLNLTAVQVQILSARWAFVKWKKLVPKISCSINTSIQKQRRGVQMASMFVREANVQHVFHRKIVYIKYIVFGNCFYKIKYPQMIVPIKMNTFLSKTRLQSTYSDNNAGCFTLSQTLFLLVTSTIMKTFVTIFPNK